MGVVEKSERKREKKKFVISLDACTARPACRCVQTFLIGSENCKFSRSTGWTTCARTGARSPEIRLSRLTM